MNEHKELFETPANNAGKTCRTCVNRQSWQCGGRVIQYCGIHRSNRTDNGLLKIKVTDASCPAYKEDKK